jgi:glyoxylase I family protein
VLQLPNTDVEIEMFEITPQRPASKEISYTNAPGIRHLCFVVEDMQAAYESLTRQGIEFVERPITVKEPKEVAGVSFAYFKDPEGNLIELNQFPG